MINALLKIFDIEYISDRTSLKKAQLYEISDASVIQYKTKVK